MPSIAKTSENGDELAKDLERVLRITQPKVMERRPVLPAAGRSTAKPTLLSSARTVKPVIAQTISKGKGKATAQPEAFPWDAAGLSSSERAKLAMLAINDCMKSLNSAVQAGYRYKGGKLILDWTEDTVMGLVEKCEASLRSLRAQGERGELGSKTVEVERAAQGVVGKCLSLGMVHLIHTTK